VSRERLDSRASLGIREFKESLVSKGRLASKGPQANREPLASKARRE